MRLNVSWNKKLILFSYFRKLFNLTKDDDVRQYVIKRPLVVKEGKKPKHKAPKIQRLITPVMLQRKRHRVAIKRRRAEKNRQVRKDEVDLDTQLKASSRFSHSRLS